jgi:hypothetical protein
MKKLLFISVSALSTSAQTLPFSWVRGITSKQNLSITADSLGNVYTVGTFRGKVDFNPSLLPQDTFFLQNNSTTLDDAFVLKLNAAGVFQWAFKIGTDFDYDAATTVKADAQGNVYVSGTFGAFTVDFDPSPATFTMSSNNRDGFVAKYSSAGSLIWAKNNVSSGLQDNNFDLVLDNSGNAYITGLFRFVADFDPSPTTFTLSYGGGSTCGFVQKLDANGNLVWAKGFNGTNNSDDCNGISIGLDNAGNVYSHGYFRNVIDFDPSPIATNTLVSSSAGDTYFLKLNTLGDFVWVKQIDLPPASMTSGKVKFDEQGNAYLASSFTGTVDVDPGAATNSFTTTTFNWDILLEKINNNGNFVWAKQMGGSSLDYANAIDVDRNGKIIISGSYQLSADFNPGAAVNTLTTSGFGDDDIFIATYDNSGNYLSAERVGSNTNSDRANSVCFDTKNITYLCGNFRDIGDFNPSPVAQSTIGIANTESCFILKLGGIISSVVENTKALNKLSIYPNPAKEIVYFKSETANTGSVTYTISDITGKTLMQGTTSDNYISVSTLTAGMYFFKLNEHQTYKFIKE